jgi:hypothetical protein
MLTRTFSRRWFGPCCRARLKRILKDYFKYYNRYRVHQGFDMDTPDGRTVQARCEGKLVPITHIGGLHYTYERRVA